MSSNEPEINIQDLRPPLKECRENRFIFATGVEIRPKVKGHSYPALASEAMVTCWLCEVQYTKVTFHYLNKFYIIIYKPVFKNN
jgi:hypothetical protein